MVMASTSERRERERGGGQGGQMATTGTIQRVSETCNDVLYSRTPIYST